MIAVEDVDDKFDVNLIELLGPADDIEVVHYDGVRRTQEITELVEAGEDVREQAILGSQQLRQLRAAFVGNRRDL